MAVDFDKKRFLERLMKSKSRRVKKCYSLKPKLVSAFTKRCKDLKEKPNEVLELFMGDFVDGEV